MVNAINFSPAWPVAFAVPALTCRRRRNRIMDAGDSFSPIARASWGRKANSTGAKSAAGIRVTQAGPGRLYCCGEPMTLIAPDEGDASDEK